MKSPNVYGNTFNTSIVMDFADDWDVF